ncbi:hypothetical protein D0860_00132 [Hortaea werneckii]|uniref:Very long-chain fatty acid transport protein n=1 Tax=Hortaea werneckii TaxID=91943 RepID=A0A3M7HX32_HORWE|nr:hypothetical protein D0860_00132 [Hortaea werneckii]
MAAASVMAALSEIPRSVAVPAATASAAYLNAKFGVVQDIQFIYRTIAYAVRMNRLEKQDRVNCFYYFEDTATNPKFANRHFLVVPRDDSMKAGQQTAWTYAEAYETVLKYARWLTDVHGVQKNEIVAMDFTNRPQFIWMWLALWSIGAKPAFINSNLRSNAFVHCVRISSARLLFVDAQIQDVLNEDTRPELSETGQGRAIDAHILDDDMESSILSGTTYRAPDSARSGDKLTSPSILIYTSGTTGLPKAATVSWTKPISGAMLFPELLGLTPEDRYFTAMPLYHSSASVLGVCQALNTGCTMIVSPKFSPKTYMKQVHETDATVIQYIGEACRYLVSSPPGPYDQKHNLRMAFGNGMRPDVWQRFKDRFNIPEILEFYGATEAPGASIVLERNGFYRGAIGRSGGLARLLFGGNSVLIKHDLETDTPIRDKRSGFCVKCNRDEPGELIYPLDPTNIGDKFSGYFGNNKASSSKILRDVFKKGDAYYRSGDLQKLDREGRWWFVDRIGDTFRWKGENVSTAEVSEALGSHPSVSEANVYGVALPNHDGRAGCVALGLASEQQLNATLRTELASHLRKRLPRYAVPLFLRLMKEEQEVTGTLKHQKVALRNDGVDPSKVGADELYWLPPGGEAYEPFGDKEWQRVVGGQAKL